MNKEILEEYIDACELIRETEEDIRKLEKKQKAVQQDSVQGSNPEFPYQKMHFHIEGINGSLSLDNRIAREKKLLQERKENAERIKEQVQQFINTAPPRMQRIIRMKFFEGNTWEQVANKLGRKANGESVRKEFENFLK